MTHHISLLASALQEAQESTWALGADQAIDTLRDLAQPEATIGWGTLAMINGGLAQGKNRSGLNWFLISLLLGPFATFILVAFCEKLPSEE